MKNHHHWRSGEGEEARPRSVRESGEEAHVGSARVKTHTKPAYGGPENRTRDLYAVKPATYPTGQPKRAGRYSSGRGQ